MRKRLAVFDLDGTLVNSAQVVTKILNHLRRKMGKEAKKMDYFVPWLSLGGADLVANGLEIDPKDAATYLREFREEYAALPTPPSTVYPEVEELLGRLDGLGVNLCICTNKPRSLARKVLSETGLHKYFKYMSAGGDLETKKPHPRNLEICIEHFSESLSGTVFIGDSAVDQFTALSLGVDFAYFEGGYNDGVDEKQTGFSFKKHLQLINLFE